MLDKGQLFARLQSGASMDAILEDLTEELNTAEKEYQKVEAEKLKKEKEATRVYEAKREAVKTMLGALADYYAAAGAEDLVAELEEVKVGKLIDLLDGSIKLSKIQFPLWFPEFSL